MDLLLLLLLGDTPPSNEPPLRSGDVSPSAANDDVEAEPGEPHV
jgi:hypothetical protein